MNNLKVSPVPISIFVTNIVSVQPMTAPSSGSIFYMDYHYGGKISQIKRKMKNLLERVRNSNHPRREVIIEKLEHWTSYTSDENVDWVYLMKRCNFWHQQLKELNPRLTEK